MAIIKEIKPSKEVWVGNLSASVSIVAFIDYESQPCAQLNEVLKEILDTYEGRIKINFRHFPLSSKHQKAMKAAEAAVAAAQENLFWPMHNIMFANRKKLGTISLKSYAREIGITNKKFLDQLVNGMYAWAVREDLIEGLSLGVRDVPAVFINAILYKGEINFSGLTEAIEVALRSSQ